MQKITAFLASHARDRPHHPFLFDLERSRGLDYREADARVNSLCHTFQSLRLTRGDLVALYLENSLDFCLLLLASLRFGTVVLPYPDSFVPAELRRDSSLFRPKVIFARSSSEPDLRSSAERFVAVDSLEELSIDAGACAPVAAFRDEATADENAILYPSAGASRHPRGIFTTHGNISALIPSLVRGFRLKADERHLVVLPLSHSAALNYSLFPAIFCGASVVISKGFWTIRDDFWNLCSRFDVSYVEVVPTILHMLHHLPAAPDDRLSLPYIACGSAPLSSDLQKEFEGRFHLPVANLYGLTETGPTHVDDPRSRDWKPGTIGRPLSVNDVVILDEDGHFVPEGEPGEIGVRGANVSPGYALLPEEGRKRILSGYFLTGDVGYRESSGLFYFCRRKKPLIIRAGINIHPEEINEVLRLFNGVVEASTTGVPDDFFGEEIRSTVSLAPGIEASEAALKTHCQGFLSPLKIPDIIRLRVK